MEAAVHFGHRFSELLNSQQQASCACMTAHIKEGSECDI
jgi:hypothetical protein